MTCASVSNFQAISTVVIGACVAYIAWRQWVTAHQKLALDLFNKRFEVFDTINAYYLPHNFFRDHSVSKDKVQRAIREAFFLFDEEISSRLNKAYFMEDRLAAIQEAGIAAEMMQAFIKEGLPTATSTKFIDLRRLLKRFRA